jgi:hypothetical protein
MKLIEKFGCDICKAGNNVNIAIEYAKHWKRGHVKQMIEEKKGHNLINCV